MLWWSMIEASLGLIVACLPVLRPLLSNIKFGRTPRKDRSDGVSEESRQRLFTLEPYPAPAFRTQSKPGSWTTPSNPSLHGEV